MEAVTATIETPDAPLDFLREWVQSWVKACDHFRIWEREELILKRPSPEIVAEHGRRIKSFIWSARLLQAMMSDPDYPLREFRREVDGKLLQLEATLRMIHDPMPDAESDTVLKAAFWDGY